MTDFLGTKTLNAEQAALVNAMSAASLFGDEVNDSVLDTALYMRKRKDQETFIQPYADALFEYIKGEVLRDRDAFFEVLKEKGSCDIYAYTTLFYNQSLMEKKRALDAIPLEERYTTSQMMREGLPEESTLGIRTWLKMDEEWCPGDTYLQMDLHYAIKMHRIFKSSPDLLVRIAMLFGPKFQASLVYDTIERKEGQWGWSHQHVTIRVTYVGDALPSAYVEKMLAVLKKETERVPFTLGNKHWLYSDCFAEKPAPKPVALLGSSSVARHLIF